MQKYTPLIILAMFIAATVAIIYGLNNAHSLAHPQKNINSTKTDPAK